MFLANVLKTGGMLNMLNVFAEIEGDKKAKDLTYLTFCPVLATFRKIYLTFPGFWDPRVTKQGKC